MFAKLIVEAPTRALAIARMRRALAETEIGGIQSTLPFHRWLMAQPEFGDDSGAGLSTDFIARAWQPRPLVAAAARRAAELAAMARTESPSPAAAMQRPGPGAGGEADE